MPRPSGWQPFSSHPSGSRPFPGRFSGHHRPRGRSFFFWGSPLYPGFGAPYGWLPPDEYPPDDYGQGDQGPPAQAAPQEDPEIASQVERLTEEVEVLRGQQGQGSGNVPDVAANETSAERAVPAVLVYRDGRHREIENYAILGDTLWVFAGQSTRRIALAELDLKATQRLNDERGIPFIASPVSN